MGAKWRQIIGVMEPHLDDVASFHSRIITSSRIESSSKFYDFGDSFTMSFMKNDGIFKFSFSMLLFGSSRSTNRVLQQWFFEAISPRVALVLMMWLFLFPFLQLIFSVCVPPKMVFWSNLWEGHTRFSYWSDIFYNACIFFMYFVCTKIWNL